MGGYGNGVLDLGFSMVEGPRRANLKGLHLNATHISNGILQTGFSVLRVTLDLNGLLFFSRNDQLPFLSMGPNVRNGSESPLGSFGARLRPSRTVGRDQAGFWLVNKEKKRMEGSGSVEMGVEGQQEAKLINEVFWLFI